MPWMDINQIAPSKHSGRPWKVSGYCRVGTLDIGVSNWGIHPVRELQHKGIVLVAPIIGRKQELYRNSLDTV